MWNPTPDIFSQSWLDIVFEQRNKLYGAYALRQHASRYEALALAMASSLFILALLIPFVKNRYFVDRASEFASLTPEREVVIELMPPLPIDPAIPEPPAAATPPAPRVDQVRMPEPEVVRADQVTEEPPTVATLKLANPGPETLEGNPEADIHIDLHPGKGKEDAAVTERGGDSDVPFVSVEVEPEFPGGMTAFLKYVQDNYRYPAPAVEQGVNGRIILQFIVERDGSLTDIKIIRDLRFGTGEEAVRLLKSSPKWRPGIQNGRPVRVTYTLPIALAIGR